MAKLEQYKEQLTNLQARLYQFDSTIKQLEDQKETTKKQADMIAAAIQGIEEDRKEAIEEARKTEEGARKKSEEKPLENLKQIPPQVEGINEKTLVPDASVDATKQSVEEKKTTT